MSLKVFQSNSALRDRPFSWCGNSRDGLLNTVRPDFRVLGQKDAQQALVIRRLVKDLAFDTEIVILPIVREDRDWRFRRAIFI